jgi:hypothetical protein
MDYLKIGKATELTGKNRVLYRIFEIIPGFLSISTLLVLLILSYFLPVWVAFFIIAFNIYWLFLVVYLAIHLITAYNKLKKNTKIDWLDKCENLKYQSDLPDESLAKKGVAWQDLWQLIILPTYNEDLEIIRSSLRSILEDNYKAEKKIVVLAMEERAGSIAKERAQIIRDEFADKFAFFQITFHPDNIADELKGKGANQAWAMKEVKKAIIDKHNLNYDHILVSVFDIDTIVYSGYFFVLSYYFLSVKDPYKASYQPVPIYHNNVWQAPFFSRVAAASNTFWQMMMQVRDEMLVTYSSHSMTFKALVEIDFWSTKMVSEDSRIFWHCLFFYNGNYRVIPLYFPISMDITEDKSFIKTAKNLYKQQRRWAWGSENIPYLIFNTIKRWETIDRKKLIGHIFIQIYGFHSWATNALIIAVIGWMPLILGGDRFSSTVLSGNLPTITSYFMSLAMIGLFTSSIVSFLLLPKRPKNITKIKKLLMILEWVFIPVTIILFGAIPCFDAQIRLIRGKYMGFWVTPKSRN